MSLTRTLGILHVGAIVACSAAFAQEPNPQSAPSGTATLGTAEVAPDAPEQLAPAGSVTSKVFRYAKRVVGKYDTNADGRLSPQEWASLRGEPATADLDHDGQITVDEFARFVANHGAGRRIRLSTTREPAAQPSAAPSQSLAGEAATAAAGSEPTLLDRRRDLKFFAPLPNGVPSWFVERDADGDAQLTLVEYSPKLLSKDVAEFRQYDLNGDGVLTASELSRKPATQPATPGAGNGALQ